MRKCKHIISLVLVLALLLSVAVLPSAAAETPALRDAGFEGSIWSDGIWSYWLPDGESWSGKEVQDFLYSSDSWMTPATDGGSQCIKFYMSAAGTAYFTQVLTNVPTGTYELSVLSMGGDGETVEVIMGEMVGDTVQNNSGYNNWTTSSGTFTLTEDCAELIVGVKITCTAGGWGYFDNLSLTGASQSVTLEEITLPNGDFENSTTNWTLTGYSSVATNQWASNNTTNTLDLWLSDTEAVNGAASYTVTLSAGTYYFTFDLSGHTIDSGLSYKITAGETELAKGDATYTTGGWDVWQTESTAQFTLTDTAEVTFTLGGNQNAGYWGNLDNLKLYGTGDVAVKDPDPVDADIYVPYIKQAAGDDFMRGMDISTLLSQLNSGVKYYDDDGNVLDGQGFMDYLAECGTNWVRIRVWNDPYDENGNGYGGGNCDLDAAITMGKWATNAGLRVLIDFHYSDFWADPGKQSVPKAWTGYTVAEKEEAIYQYTYDSLTALKNAGVDVGMVQIGNETTSKLCGESNWTNICKLMNAGSKAVREVLPDALVAIHFTNPERATYASYYAATLDSNNVDYDVFASSYYPYWHGTLENLTSELKKVATTYGKQVIVAETSWAYTLEDGDGHDNTVRANNNDTGAYDYSAQGQATELTDVIQAVVNVGEAGIGVFYWEPAWTPVGTPENKADNLVIWETYGSGWASSYAGGYSSDAATWYGGSAWDNQAMFDFEGHPLDSLKTYLYLQTGTSGFEIYITGVDAIQQNYIVGDTLSLPTTATVHYSFGSDQSLEVIWDEASLAAVDMNTPGTYTVTGTVDGYAVEATVIVMYENLLVNPSFEGSDMSMYESSQSYAKRTTDDPYTGSYSLHFYNSGLVSFTTEQTVTLQPGHYVFSMYGQGGDVGDTAETYVYVTVGDETYTQDFALTGWQVWADPQIAFDVTEETEVTVGVSVTASQNGAWGTFDDWYLGVDADPEHSGSEATCCEKAVCDICGVEYGDVNMENHVGGGEATCISKAVCDGCGNEYGELNPDNHTGGFEIRDAQLDTEHVAGYTGDTYCLDCGALVEEGEIVDELLPDDTPIDIPTPEDPEDEDDKTDENNKSDEDDKTEDENKTDGDKTEDNTPNEKPEDDESEENPKTGDSLAVAILSLLSSTAALPIFKRRNRK